MRASGTIPAQIMLVDECYRKSDLESGKPFGGYSGDELGRVLGEAGIAISQCFCTWAARREMVYGGELAFPRTKKLIDTNIHVQIEGVWVEKELLLERERLVREIESVQPNLIIAFGNTAMWLLTGKLGIGKWRGSQLTCTLSGLSRQVKVIPVYPIGRVFANWEWRPILVQDLRRCRDWGKDRNIIPPDYSFLIRPNYSQSLHILQTLYQELERGPLPLAVDIETRQYQIACIGISWNKLEAICIPLLCVERPDGYWQEEEEVHIYYWLYKVLCHSNVQIIGQNYMYDIQYTYRHFHFTTNFHFDTMLAQHVMFSNMPKGLDFLSSMYCEFHLYWKDDGKEWDSNTPEDQLWRYNCVDCVRTYEIWQKQVTIIKSMGLEEVNLFQQALFWPVLACMKQGLCINTSMRGALSMSLFDAIQQREQYLQDILGEPLNIKSSKQMQELFYQALGQKSIISKKTRAVTCDDTALTTLKEREPLLLPLINPIQELRSLGVFLSTFVKAKLDIDGRMRCDFKMAGTETYRFSSCKNSFGSGMNLQNIPSGDDNLPNIRKLFVPDTGMEFFDIDLSAADLRIVVWESDCKEMKQMLLAGLDPYTEIAKEFYHDPSITKYDPRRQTFKSFAHGTNYLGTAKGLAGRLGLSIKEAESTQRWYFGKFPEIRAWQNATKVKLNTRKMVENVFGYRTYFFCRVEGTVYNQAIAWIPQSTVACLINRIWMRIYKDLPEVNILLQVHDSLAGQYPASRAPHFRQAILDIAKIELPYNDSLLIPVGIKTSTVSWGDCK